jgi:hypothetical protein
MKESLKFRNQIGSLGTLIGKKEQKSIGGGIAGCFCGWCISVPVDDVVYRSCSGRCPSGFRFYCQIP